MTETKSQKQIVSEPNDLTPVREYIYGGTFDPVHNGHLELIEQMRLLAPSIVIRVIPCAVPALKKLPGTSFKQRCEMLELALKNFSNIEIDQREAEREGASYTIDTIEELKKEHPEKLLTLVMGADSINDIQKWHRWESLSNFCHLLVFNRPGFDDSEIRASIRSSGFKLFDDFDNLKKTDTGGAFYAQMPEKQESSTEIRQSSSLSGAASYMLPESVIEYIRKNRLYTGENS